MRTQLGDPGSPTPSSSAPASGRPETRLLSISERDGIYRARLNDAALRSIDTHKLRTEIGALHRRGRRVLVVLSMRNMDTVASGPLGALAQLSAELESVGGVLVLYAVPKEVARVLKKTRLDRLIHTARDQGSARKKALALSRKHASEPPRGPARTHAA